MKRELPPRVVTFIVRVSRDAGGRVRGVVERVRTGQKRQVSSIAEVAAAIESLTAIEEGAQGRQH